jgi:protein-tyrosine phosphatase
MKPSRRAITSALLSLLFLVVYVSCNWFTSRRTDVGMFYFEWERHIPFVPWMIVPYMSIDLFFVAAPFVCRTEEEVHTLAKRIVFAILFSGACFLLFPLQFAFERPPVSGGLGVVFNNFRNFDHPYNLFPSLHITLRTILAAVYARHSRGMMRILSDIWFILIGFSTVLTYQHHVADVIGGFILAGYCFYLFRETPTKLPVMPNMRIGIYYAVGAIIVTAISRFFGLWGLFLFWPVLSLVIVAAAYFGLGPGIYRKINGRLPLSTRFVLGPCLFGQYISLCYYRRTCQPWNEVIPGVWIGRKLNDTEATEAVRQGVAAVLDVTAEFNEARPFLNVEYLNLQILDLTSPTQEQMKQMAGFINEHSSKGIVYVHCKIGYSRSAAAVGAYLLAKAKAVNVQEVIHKLRSARPSIIVRPEIFDALSRFNHF